jgi:methylmalonyl-CoA/ethylmalonyl-CoA epimerase
MAESVPIIDHVGIAVNSLEGAIPLYAALLGESPVGEETVPSEAVRVAFFGEGAGRVELLEPTSPDSAIARFIDRRGQGLHHICLRVSDLDAALRHASETGVAVIPPGPKVGSAGHRVAFLHPRSTHGVLLELVERPAEVEPGG